MRPFPVIGYLRFRSDGVSVLDVRALLTRDGTSVEVQTCGYLVPAAGALPSPEVKLAPEFTRDRPHARH